MERVEEGYGRRREVRKWLKVKGTRRGKGTKIEGSKRDRQ